MKSLSLMVLLALFCLVHCTNSPEQDATQANEQNSTATPISNASTISSPNTIEGDTFKRIMEFALQHKLYEQPFGQIMQQIGEQFIGKPYVAGQLDVPSTETLIVNFDSFDCVLYVETVLALSRTVATQDYSFETFKRYIEDQRYRDGAMDGYCSRLHYFTEWIVNNEERGTVDDISEEIGGVVLNKEINFMSTHRDSYPRLADAINFDGILEMEATLKTHTFYYIPQDKISKTYDMLEAGDIVAAATDIKGLDVTHTGLVYDKGNGTKGFMHASTSGGVKISPDLQSYIQGVKSQIGVIVARPKDPRQQRSTNRDF